MPARKRIRTLVATNGTTRGEIKESAAQRVMQAKGCVLCENAADNDKDKTWVDLVVTTAREKFGTTARDMFETARILFATTAE